MDNSNLIGVRLRNARVLRRMRVDDVSRDSGIPCRAIEDIESGRRIPPLYYILALSVVLEVDNIWLSGEEYALPCQDKTDRVKLAQMEKERG